MSGKTEDYGLLLAGLLAFESLVDGGPDGMAGLGSRDDAFGFGEQASGLECIGLIVCDRGAEPFVVGGGDERSHTVVSEASGMDALGDELASESVHHEERGHASGVSVVVPELSLGERRSGLGFDGDDLGLGLASDLLPHHREGESGEVGSSAHAGDHVVGDDLGLVHLLDGLQSDDGLVEHDMVENASEGIACTLVLHGELACLGYSDSERSCGAPC